MTVIEPVSVPLSVLDLAPITMEGSAATAFANSLDLARHVERLGFHRFWLAEHHNMPGIASAATSILIGHVAGGTRSIRVGSGGVMLPNHAPLVIAEQFGTLESLYPGRIDLGLGRAPGSDPGTARALRRVAGGSGDSFPRDLQELRGYFQGSGHPGGVHAVPGEGLKIPIWLLGSSDFSARLAAELGLPFAFASHFAPDYLLPALEVYRGYFQPSESCPEPYAMVAVNVFAADSLEEARFLQTSQMQQVLNLIRGRPGKLPPPVENMDELWNLPERMHVENMTRFSLVGTAAEVRQGLDHLLRETQANEVMVSSHVYDHTARRRSFEILAQAAGLAEGG